MNPDQKYMSEVSRKNNITFIPPSFNSRNTYEKIELKDEFLNLDLFPSKIGLPKLCCNSDEGVRDVTGNSSMDNIYSNLIPTTFDALRSLDLDLDENEDLERVQKPDNKNNKDKDDNNVFRIYHKIEKNNPGIFATLYSYNIPRPIARVIVRRLIKLTLLYDEKDKKRQY